MDVDSGSDDPDRSTKADMEDRDDSEDDEEVDEKPEAMDEDDDASDNDDNDEDQDDENDDENDDEDDASDKSGKSESGDDDSDDSSDDSDDGDGSENDDEDDDGISDYEKLRMERIKRNQERLQQLGLAGKSGGSAFASLKPAKKPVKRKPRKQVEPVILPKRSSRSRSAKKDVSYSLKYDFRGKEIKVSKSGASGGHTAKKPRVVRWIHDEFRRIGRVRKHNLKTATKSLKSACKELNYWSRRMQVFAEKKQRVVNFEKKLEQDKKEREEFGGYTRSEILKDIDRRSPQLESLLLKYDIQEANVAKTEEERQALLERMMQREAFDRKMEMIDALDRFPKALRDATTSLNLMLYNRSPKDPPPPRRSKRNSIEGDDRADDEEEVKTKGLEKGDDGWTNMVVEKPTVPAETSNKDRKKEVRNVGGWVSPMFGEELDRSWLERENAVQDFDLNSYVPQVGDTILYYPGVHKAFLKKYPDMLWKTTRNPLRVPLWQRAFKERTKGTKGDEETWWTNEWLDSPEFEAYPLVCRVERTHAEFPPDPYAQHRTVDKDGNVVWNHPKNLKPKKKKTGMRLAVLLKPLTPLLPPTFDEENGLQDDKKCALPPKFYVSTVPMKNPFVVPFVWAFALTHSLKENESIDLPDAESNRAKVKSFHGLESNHYGSFRLDDKMQVIRRILNDLESSGVGETSMQDRIEQQMTYNDSGSSFSATDAGLIVGFLKAFMDERETTGKSSKAETSGNLLDLIRSCLPLSQNIEVQPNSFHRKTTRVSRWIFRRKKSTKAEHLGIPGIQSGCLHSLEDSLRTKIAFAIEESINETEFCEIFCDPVKEEDAPGYYCAVPIGMYFNRILNRLRVTKGSTCYYTSVESVLSDLQGVADNCLLYNSLNSDIAKLCVDIVSTIKRQVSDVFSKHVKEQSSRIKAEEERRRFVLENCAPSVVGDDTSTRRGKGHVVPDWLNSPYEGELYRKWMQSLNPDGSWTNADNEGQDASMQNWAPQSGDVVHYSRFRHAQFVKGHIESLAKEQCIVPRFSNSSNDTANDEDAEQEVDEADDELSQKLQTHCLVASIVSVRSTFPRKEDTKKSFETASPVLAIGLRFPYSWANGKVFTVCWRPCCFENSDKSWKCPSCGLGESSFLSPAWLAKDATQRDYEVLECSGESKFPTEIQPPGIPQLYRSSIASCFDILKKRCLAETDPDYVDPKSCLSNAERGVVTKAPTPRSLPSFEALVSESEETPSSSEKKASSRKNATTKDAKDKKEANAVHTLSRICFLPPWSGPVASDKDRSGDAYKTKLPLTCLSLELVCLRVKNGYYRQPAAILNDLTEAYVTSVLYTLSNLMTRKRNLMSVRKIAKYLHTTTKNAKLKKIIDSKEAKQKTRKHESVAKDLAPMGKENLLDNEQFENLKSEEKEWIRRIEQARKLYTMAILCVTDTDLLQQIFGLPIEKDEADGDSKDNSKSELEPKLREEGIRHIRYLLSAVAEDPSDFDTPFKGQIKVSIKCDGKLVSSNPEDGSVDMRVLGSNELERNDDLCRVFVGEPGRRAACVRCQVAGNSMLSCRVSKSHSNVDFAFADFFRNGRGVDGLIEAATPVGSSPKKGGGQVSMQATEGGNIASRFDSDLIDPTENFKKARTAFELAKILHKDATILTQVPARLGDDFIRSYFPVDESDGHYIYCIVCGRSGDLVCCEGCPTVVHADCIGLRRIPDGDWYCKKCTSSQSKDQDDIVGKRATESGQASQEESGSTESNGEISKDETTADPLPKSPVPAYFQFLNDRRNEVQAQNPGATSYQISKILSNLWKSSSDEVRNKYIEEEANQRKAYQLAMAEYRKSKAGKQIPVDEAQSYSAAVKFLASAKELRHKARPTDESRKPAPTKQHNAAHSANGDVPMKSSTEKSDPIVPNNDLSTEKKAPEVEPESVPRPPDSRSDSSPGPNGNSKDGKNAAEVEHESKEQAESRSDSPDCENKNPNTGTEENAEQPPDSISDSPGSDGMNFDAETATDAVQQSTEQPSESRFDSPGGENQNLIAEKAADTDQQTTEQPPESTCDKVTDQTAGVPDTTAQNSERESGETKPEKLEEAVAIPSEELKPAASEETDDFDYLAEVLDRAKKASEKDCAQKCAKGVGLLLNKKNAYCHICHKRSDAAYGFACRYDTHNYCVRHALERFDFSSKPYKLDHCPICCLHCQCSACRRKANNLAREFKEHCQTTNKTGTAAKFSDILDRCAVVSGARLTSFVAWDDQISDDIAPRQVVHYTPVHHEPSSDTEPIQPPPKWSSAYFFFCREFRKQIFEDEPDTEFREVGKILGQRWRALDDDGKKKYHDLSRADKRRYEKEMEEYHEQLEKAASAPPPPPPDADEESIPQEEEIPVPQKPYPAYFQFANSKRALVKKENPGLGSVDVSRIVADMWRSMSDEDKQYYVDEESKQRKKYNEEMEEYHKKVEEQNRRREAERPKQAVIIQPTTQPSPQPRKVVTPQLLPEAVVHEQMQNLGAILRQLSSLHPKTASTSRRKISPPVVPIGTKFKKYFDGHGEFDGKVVRVPDEESNLYGVEYDDDDEEELTLEELLSMVSDSVRDDFTRAQRDYKARLNRQRGRPRKSEVGDDSDAEDNDPDDGEYLEDSIAEVAPLKRKRGRPRKNANIDEEAPRRKRGRPRKVDPSGQVASPSRKRMRASVADDSQFFVEGTPQKRGRGRPRKDEQSPGLSVKRPRGRPRKRKLEDDDFESANFEEAEPPRKRGRPRKRLIEEPQAIEPEERQESPEDPNKRRSNRSTKFRKVMRDAASDSVRDLFAGSSVTMTLGGRNSAKGNSKGSQSQTSKRLEERIDSFVPEYDDVPTTETKRGRRGRTPTKRLADEAEVAEQEESNSPPARRGRRGRTPTKRLAQEDSRNSSVEKSKGRRSQSARRLAETIEAFVQESDETPSTKAQGGRRRTPIKKSAKKVETVEQEPSPVAATRGGRQSRAPKRFVQEQGTPEVKSKKAKPLQTKPKRAKSMPPAAKPSTNSSRRTRHSIASPPKEIEKPSETRSRRRRG